MSPYSAIRSIREFFSPQHLVRRSVETHYALAEACLIGLVSAFAALMLKQGVGWLGTYRIHLANEWGAGFVLPVFGLVFGMLAGWCVERLSPATSGGGIPQVKAVLGQFSLPLSLRVAVVKTIGTIMVLGAGLTLGRRGPTVHIGAALAAQLSSWVPTSPEHRRQMIAAGAAAGLAAGFNTPIAGVMFVIEELMRDASGLTLETAILASFTGAIVSRLLGSADLNLPESVLNSSRASFSAPEIPIFILLGLLAGVLGALFNRGIILAIDWNRRLSFSMHWRVGIAGLISGAIVAFLPDFFRNNAGLREFLITGNSDWQTIAIIFIAHFFLTLLAYGSGAPGGLFAPALVMGAALGYLVAQIGGFVPHTYIFAGMGAFFTAVVRVPVTAIIIVFELRSDFNLVLPLMIGSAVAYIVAETVYQGSIYQHLLEASGIKLQENSYNHQFLGGIKATEVMQRQVETLPIDLTLDEVLKVVSRSSHHGFPVVKEGELVGLVTQQELANLGKLASDSLLTEVMIPRPVTVNPDATLTDVLYLLNRYQLSHLPVLEGQKLLGIITRSDVIRVEADHLGGEANAQWTPSYVVYQTRGPATGRGRILLPLSNPKTAPALLKMAAAIARYRQYELECIQIMLVPRHQSPDRAKVRTTNGRRLFRVAEKVARQTGISLHTQVRVTHDVAQAILETVAERHIDILLMGWKGTTLTPGQIFGYVTDTIIQQAPCDVVLVKQGSQPHAYPHKKSGTTKLLLPFAGGPNSQRALQLIPSLKTLARFQRIWLCQVYSPNLSQTNFQELQNAAQSLQEELGSPVKNLPIRAYSVSEAVIRLTQAENYDVVVLGATREGLLQQAIQGNIPQAIALGVDSTVILVRGAL